MSQQRRKYKINTNGKSYQIHDSPFYKLSSKKKLLSVLCITKEQLQSVLSNELNYNVFSQVGKTGKPRKIEHPINSVDKIHTRIASLLCRISQPEFMHSGVKGFSHVTNAKAHLGSHKTLTTDIKSFFPSTKKSMVFHFFYKRMKCSPDVADIMARITTFESHIPTGSRISMPLAFWANMDMFFELEKLAKLHNAIMTVYVDDLTFSGKAVNNLFKSIVKKIISKHGHIMHPKKTILYQHDDVKVITGVVLKNDSIAIKNQQHANIHADMIFWKIVRDDLFVPQGLKNRLLGRLNSLSVIAPSLKDKARSINNYKRKSKKSRVENKKQMVS
ncbi:putative Reverse transcriptase (RNA-dependent DNA polymerase) [Shewanella benthica]|uniref:Putative Reverse transcriptase (RNA-dependent DNA polymerase) n=1 Tax=Shewanella benthica TaxID=43661 RepID=A0A330MAV8_9GAMM|nr:reverse transcriptase family protein [Shewanella benthica]SQH76927.1 putative Reverse transcriptase (RNA-dependent DNA polymerase) [Shewanella benthica]